MVLCELGVLKWVVFWLLFFGLFFFVSYGLVNWLISQCGDVGSLVFDWECGMLLWFWIILLYWLIDLFYGLLLLLLWDKCELDIYCLCLFSVQVLLVICFLLFFLCFIFEWLELGGVFGWLFDVLMGFDKLYNQVLLLYIVLLVVFWVCYVCYVSGVWCWLLYGWFVLIGLLVLIIWQYYFIDVFIGVLVGWLCVWLWLQVQFVLFVCVSLSCDW